MTGWLLLSSTDSQKVLYALVVAVEKVEVARHMCIYA